MRRLPFLFLAVFLVAPAQAEDRPAAKWRETEQVFLANSGPRETRSYDQDGYILRVPLVWLEAVRLERTVEFAVGEERETIEAGRVLPLVHFSANGDTENMIDVFCTPRDAQERAMENGFMGAMFGGVVTRAITKGLSDTQRCLVDTDQDSAFDQMLIVGEGPGNHRFGERIEPVPYKREAHLPISQAENEVRIQIDSIGRRSLTFQLEFIQQGRKRNFDRVTAQGYSAESRLRVANSELPKKITYFGAEFEILAFDHGNKSITVRWPEDADANARPIIPQNWVQHVNFLPY